MSDFDFGTERILYSELKQALAQEVRDVLRDLRILVTNADRQNEASELLSRSLMLAETVTGASDKVLTDPRVVATVDRSQTAIAEHGLGHLNSDEWRRAIDVLARIGPAMLFLSGVDFESELLIAGGLDVALPGTALVISGREAPTEEQFRIRIGGSSGTVSVSDARFRVDKRPEGAILLASPESCLRPHGDHEILLTQTEIDSSPWTEALDFANQLISSSSPTQALVSQFGNLVVPIRSATSGVMSSVSFDTHPGAIFTSWCEDYRMLAETLAHESDHQRHYMLTRKYEFWADESAKEARIFRSPWRDDPRPLDGLLRGASAFVSVSSFWADVLSLNPSDNWIGARSVLTNYQALDALRTIIRAGPVTMAGKQLVQTLTRSAVATKNRLQQSASFLPWLEAASLEQDAHDTKWRQSADASIIPNAESLTPAIYMNF